MSTVPTAAVTNLGLRSRRMKVTFTMPGNSGNVVLDETLDLHVRINKNALVIQNKATIDVYGLANSVRQELLSNFTAWQKNQRDVNGVVSPYIDVLIEAGYSSVASNQSTVTTVYTGQVVMCELFSPPPNTGVRITCYTHQIDKTKYITDPAPYSMTFKELVTWAGNYMGFDDQHIVFNSSHGDEIVYNGARSIIVTAGLLPYIQDIYHPDVAAYIDDGFLYVKDRNKAINATDIAQVNQFIGMPCWTQWGVEGTTLLDPSIRVGGAVQFTSILNPSLNGQFVVSELEYDLTSRDTPFYVKINGTPPAA